MIVKFTSSFRHDLAGTFHLLFPEGGKAAESAA